MNLLGGCVLDTQGILDCMPSDCDTSLLQEIRKRMPCFTPCQSDVIAYATVREASVAKSDDVGQYMEQLTGYSYWC